MWTDGVGRRAGEWCVVWHSIRVTCVMRARDHSSNSEKKSMVERRASTKASTSAGVL